MIVCATGHRPPRLGGYGEDNFKRLVMMAEHWLSENKPNIECVISGMAQGWDQAWARGAFNVGIPFIAAVPCRGFDSKWPDPVVLFRYQWLLYAAKEVVYMADKYYHGCNEFRDKWMISRSDMCTALWDGSPAGGTYQTILHAERKPMPYVNLWKHWSGYWRNIIV